MNLFDDNLSWQALNLPEGLSLSDGVLSGTPTSLGAFDVPVTVENSLGKDSKSIRINVIQKTKFTILQNGSELEQITIPELVEAVQNGTAQDKYDCNTTQILISLIHPLSLNKIENVALNFSAFQKVTLSNGSVRDGLVLQFNNPLWAGFAPFDCNNFNRWKFSHLRRWLNSTDTADWFKKAYELDNPERKHDSFLGDNIHGFLHYLPVELVRVLQPVKILTKAFFDDFNDDPAIDDPDFFNGIDFDATFDYVFIPALSELNLDDDTFEGLPFSRKSMVFNDLDGNPCGILSRSADIEGKNKIFAVDENSNINSISTDDLSYSPTPCFVLC